MRIGILASRIRIEEKMLLAELERRDLDHEIIDDRSLVLELGEAPPSIWDVVIERSINHGRALAAIGILEDRGIRCVNSSHVANVCGNKLQTSQALFREGVPSPRVKVAFTPESALAAIEDLGYPVILKPAVGSWGRLLSKVRRSATAGSTRSGISRW